MFFERDQQGRFREITGDEILAAAERIWAERTKQGIASRKHELPTMFPWQLPLQSHTLNFTRNCRKGGCSHAHCYCCPLR